MKRIIVLCLAISVLLSVFVGCEQTNANLNDTLSESFGENERVENDEIDTTETSADFMKYHDIPFEYYSLLEAYIEIARIHRYDFGRYSEMNLEYEYPSVSAECMECIRNSIEISRSSYFISYATKDINNDGIKELFFIDQNYFIYSIITISNGIPEVLLSANNIYSTYAIDAEGNIYRQRSGKGESWCWDILYLKSDGKLYGLTYGYYNQSDFDDPDIYNYCTVYGLGQAYSSTSNSQLWECRITDEELDSLHSSVNERLKAMDTDGCGSLHHVTRDAGFTIYEVITYHGGK